MNASTWNRMVWGLALIGLGVLFLLNQTGAIDLDIGHIVADFWPVILIYFGLKGVVIQRKLRYGWGGSYIWNLFIVLLGGYFLLDNLDVQWIDDINFWQLIGPVILILYGISMLARGPRSRSDDWKRERREEAHRRRDEAREERRMEQEERKSEAYSRKLELDLDQAFQERVLKKKGDDPFPLVSETEAVPPTGNAAGSTHMPPPPPPSYKGAATGSSWNSAASGWGRPEGSRRTIDRSNFIGDIHLGGQDYWELEPTNVSHFIGDTVIDLTRARIPYGETKVNVSAFIGDVKVFVPNDVQVEIKVTASAFIGDMRVLERHEGGMFRHMKYDSLHYGDAEKKIHLTVSMFIGDIAVTRVG